ncbi:MAG: tetratricopeptide repeat protein, partial [Vitreoscilla sp.]
MQQPSQVAPSAAAHRAPGGIPGAMPADSHSAALAAVAAPGAASIVIDRNLLLQGIALQNEGKLEQAQAVFELYLAHIPNEGVALYSLAVVLMERFGAERALPVVERGVQVAAGFAPIWYAAGAVQQRLGLRDAAIRSYDKALELKPDYVEALINSGTLLREQLDHHAAIDRFNRALALKPDHLNAMSNLAIMLTEFKRSEEAVAMFERLLAIQPDFEYGVGSICYERMHACDWSHFDSDVARILAGIEAGKPVAKSLGVMSITDDAAVHHRCAEIFAAHRYTPRHAPLWTGERYRHDRILIGLVSCLVRV